MASTDLTNTQANSGAGGQIDLTHQQGGGGGYGGLQGVLDFLSGAGGINGTQYGNMMNGYGGYKVGGQMYNVPGAHGALSGLSPWAIQYLMKNMMTQDKPQQTPLTGLTGDALFQATLMNAAHNSAPALYHINSAMTDGGLKNADGTSETAEQYLASLFAGGALGSHSAYRNKNYGETGYTAPAAANPLAGHPMAQDHPHYAQALRNGYTGTYKQWVNHGKPKK